MKEITENINADRVHKRLLEFISDLFKYLLQLEDKDLSIKHYDEPAINDETKDIIDIIPEKKEEEGFSEEFSKSLIVPDINISILKIGKEKMKELMMDDIFFVEDSNWKNNIKPEYKKYPSLIYFLFKSPECEKELKIPFQKLI